jgi:hypothetical protein
MMTLALVLCSGAAFADHVGVYADATGLSCALLNPAPFPGTNTFYVVHKFNPSGATAGQFKVQDNSGLFKSGQVLTPGYLILGDWFVDVSIAYGACIVGDHVLGQLNYFWTGSVGTCATTIEILPAPGSPVPGQVAFVDCALPSGNLRSGTGGRAFYGANTDACPAGCGEVATHDATWGSIKALYR